MFNKAVTLIADGPSKEKVFNNPDSYIRESTIVVVNDVGNQWTDRIDYWFSLHPEIFFSEENYKSKETRVGWRGDGKGYIRLEYRVFPEGSSSLFALENCFEMLGAEEVHLYGVDLDDVKSSGGENTYNKFRKFWKPAVKAYGDKMVDHSYTQWLAERNWY